ncbi:fatty acid desaturase [Pontibacter sp. G13]|uniref:fatty acid desaturase family protein n=1 Tax=Pontibacter sp. G13 TaxID=3074898 RepID=UPI0028897DA5|nr:fatty acid desaturase [Pontibacter sp. G13]WNJ20319.1 fatty acid desaturase [Pontibacter sp. G13]
MTFQRIKFSKEVDLDFSKTLKKRVREYFEKNQIPRTGGNAMIIKVAFMLALYLVPLVLMLTGVVTSDWGVFGMWSIMGIGLAGIGLAIMHDACHGALSSHKKINNFLGYVLDFVGGSCSLWKIQHNVLHHSFTNIEGHDDDIAPVGVLRFSPHAEKKGVHRFQFLYAWFFYGLMTFSWVTFKDFRLVLRYNKKGLTRGKKQAVGPMMTRLFFAKVAYYTYILVLPLVLMDNAWWVIVGSWFTMHFIAGLILALIFQPAHVMPDSKYPLPDESGHMDNSWFIHQLLTTTNFSPNSKWFSWYVGGLNYQIEHHLFPSISHVHYPKLSKIVEETAKEFDLPYNKQPNFVKAVWEHGKMLYMLGR